MIWTLIAIELYSFQHSYLGLVKMHLKNLGNMRPDKWYSTYHYSHPPLVERLAALGATNKLKAA